MKYLNHDSPMTSIPISATCNSLLSKAFPVTTMSQLPLYPAPIDYTKLLMKYQNISSKVALNNKIVTSLDLQLYTKALQLQNRNEIVNNFLFRPEETFISFTYQHQTGYS